MVSAAKNSISTLRALWNFRSNPLADLSLLTQGLVDRPNPVEPDLHRRIVNRVATAYYHTQARQSELPPAYRPVGEWDTSNKRRRQEYFEALNSENLDALSALLQNFFRNSGVDGLWTYGYFSDTSGGSDVVQKRIINGILQDFRTWKGVVGGDLSSVSPPPIGNPWGYPLEGNLIMPTSFRHHYFASRVENLLADIEHPVVAEIGGGFGGFAYYLVSSSKAFTYINFDLPEVLLISSYYLLNAFPDKRVLLWMENPNGELSHEVIGQYDVILMPNFRLPQLPSSSVDLFINTASFSEMNMNVLTEYLNQVARTCKTYLYHENSDRAIPKGDGHEVPASRFPLPEDAFKLMEVSNSLWGGNGGRYKEYLYRRLETQN